MIGGLLSGMAGGATVAIVIKAVDQFSGTFKTATTKLDKLKAAGKVAGVAIAGVATGLAAFGVSAVKAAAEAETIERQFRKMTYNSDEFLTSLNKATHETVSDFELISASNKALMLGLEQNQLAEFFEKASILGQVAGRSVTEAVEDITLGVGRQSKLILDNLGIIVNAEQAYESYAQKIGTVANELTEAQKKTAFLEATLKGMTKTIEENGLVFEEGYSQKLEKIKKQFDDMKVSIGEGMIEPLSELTDEINLNAESWELLGTVIGTVLKEVIIQTGNVIKGIKTWIDYIALGVEAYTNWQKLDIQGVKDTVKKTKLYASGASYEDAQKYGVGYGGSKEGISAYREMKQATISTGDNNVISASRYGGATVSSEAEKATALEQTEIKKELASLQEDINEKEKQAIEELKKHGEVSITTQSELEFLRAKFSETSSEAETMGVGLEFLKEGIISFTDAATKSFERLRSSSSSISSSSSSYALTGSAALAQHDIDMYKSARKYKESIKDSGGKTYAGELGGDGAISHGVQTNVGYDEATGTYMRTADIAKKGGNVGKAVNLYMYNQANPAQVAKEIGNELATTGV